MNLFDNNRSSAGKGRTTRNFHRVMKGVVHAQAGKVDKLKKVPLKLGGNWIVVDIVCPLHFVINNGTKQCDQSCGRMSGHHSSMIRHHRSCNCVYEDLDNPHVAVHFLM